MDNKSNFRRGSVELLVLPLNESMSNKETLSYCNNINNYSYSRIRSIFFVIFAIQFLK